jgi:hypothetical protein
LNSLINLSLNKKDGYKIDSAMLFWEISNYCNGKSLLSIEGGHLGNDLWGTRLQGLPALATVQAPSYIDTVNANGTYFYFIMAEDSLGNRYVSNTQNITVENSLLPDFSFPVIGITFLLIELVCLMWLGVVIYRIARSPTPPRIIV